MSDCRAHPQNAKRLHTDSNLKTNTSFEFAHSSQFQFVSHLPSLPLQLEEETPSSQVYFGEGNHSTISLQPTVTPSAALQFTGMVEMVRFLSSQAEEKRRRIQSKRGAVTRLEKVVLEQEWRVKTGLDHFRRRKEVLQGKRARVEGFKKKKLRAVTEQTERVELEVNCMLKGLRVRNTSRSFIDRREVHEESSFHEQPQRHQQNRRRKIYIPILMPYQQHPYYPPHNAPYHPYYPPPSPFVHSQTQVPPWAASPKQNPSRSSLPNYNSHKVAQQDMTVQKQPILIEQLRQALTMKFKQPQISPQLDYFDSSSPSKSRQGQEEGRKSETPTPKSAIRRSSSIKWRRDDAEDKELVEIIQKSIKHIKTEHTDEQVTKKEPLPQQTPNKLMPQQPRISPVRPLRNNTSESSSMINITYDSQDKRNSKSFEREGESKIGKGSSRASEKKSDHLRQIQQSNVKIEMVDMSHSKNSNSSASDSSKHRPNRHTTPLANNIHEIQEQSQEMVSLKATPCENHGSRNSKRQQSPKQPLIKQHLPEQQQDGQDEILKSIKLDTESRISRNLFGNHSQQLPPEDDFLQGITLLKESRASREKGLSLKGSAIAQDFQEQGLQREKGSQSEIFSKDDELDEDFGFDSTLRLSTKSRIAKPGNSTIRTSTEGKQAPRRGQTQPLRAQLSSIPSAEYESEEEDTPPPSKTRKKQPPSQLH